MKVGNQKQPFISFICYEGSWYSAKGTWYLQWISMLREFIGRNWKKPRSTYFIHRDRRLICCWNRSKIATVMKQKTRIPLPKKTKSSTLSDPTNALGRCNRSWFLPSVHSLTLSSVMGGWGLSQTMRGKCSLWTWNFNLHPTQGHSIKIMKLIKRLY